MKEMRMNQQHPSCHPKEKEQLYKIGMFANMNHVTIKTLRYRFDFPPIYNYAIALVSELVITFVLYNVLARVPIARYLILGIKKNKE